MEAVSQHQQNHQTSYSETMPEKSALIRFSNGELDGDNMSDTGTVNGYRTATSGAVGGSRSFNRQSSVLRSSRKETSSSYGKLSFELAAQAESRFMVLMQVLASASKEASSLKNVWERWQREREALLEEHEALMIQTTELDSELRSRKDEQLRHNTENGGLKKKYEKLIIDLSNAHSSVVAEKDKVLARDRDLEKIHAELHEARNSLFRKDALHEREIESLKARLNQIETERDNMTQSSERYHRDLNKAVRERTDLTNKLNMMTTDHEIAQKDVISLTARVTTAETENMESLQIIDRLKEEVKRFKQKSIDDAKTALEATEKYDKISREVVRIKESLTVVESERDTHVQTIEGLRRQIKNNGLEHDDLITRFTEITQKHDSSRREITSLQEKLRAIEQSRERDLEAYERTRESLNTATRERDDFSYELGTITQRINEYKNQVVVAGENLIKAEAKVSELHIEIALMKEKVTFIQRERDDARSKINQNGAEITQFRERINTLEQEKRNAIDARTKLGAELERLRSEYNQVTETITTYGDDTEEMEQEITNLKIALREAQEERESAISTRDSADKERDLYIAKYEEKCRELERSRESGLSRSASYSNTRLSKGGRVTRTVSSRSQSQLISQSTANHNISSSNLDSSFHVDGSSRINNTGEMQQNDDST